MDKYSRRRRKIEQYDKKSFIIYNLLKIDCKTRKNFGFMKNYWIT